MSHTMQVWENVIKKKLKEETTVSKNIFRLCQEGEQWNQYFM